MIGLIELRNFALMIIILKVSVHVKMALEEVTALLTFHHLLKSREYQMMEFVTRQTSHVKTSLFMDTISWKIWEHIVMSQEKRFEIVCKGRATYL